MSCKKAQVPPEVSPMYCSGCRRFLGYESIRKGFAISYCSKCKTWTVHVGRNTNIERTLKQLRGFLEDLTTQTKDRILKREAGKAQIGQDSPRESQKGM